MDFWLSVLRLQLAPGDGERSPVTGLVTAPLVGVEKDEFTRHGWHLGQPWWLLSPLEELFRLLRRQLETSFWYLEHS